MTWGFREGQGGYAPVVRTRGIESLRRQIDHCIDDLGITLFGFTDSTPIPAIWRDLAAHFAARPQPVYRTSFAYVSHFDDADFDLFARSGCAALWYGIESGSEELRARMGKRSSNEEAISTFEGLRRVGIFGIPGFIVGFPGETQETIAATEDLARRLDSPVVVSSPFILDPGTPLSMAPARYDIELADDWQSRIVMRQEVNEFELDYYRVAGQSNAESRQRWKAKDLYPGWSQDRSVAESEYAYLLARGTGEDATGLVRELDGALKGKDMHSLRTSLERIWKKQSS